MQTKFQLALQYFPDTDLAHSDSAVRRLKRWKRQSRGLMAALEAAGYHDRQKALSERQVAIVYEYLGEP